MQFKNPDILYFLALLIIPILVHLFQLQKFTKIAFTNVAFLQKIIQ
ncbi:MAG: BatA domain-containing protein, partial [Polaribacter sp.]